MNWFKRLLFGPEKPPVKVFKRPIDETSDMRRSSARTDFQDAHNADRVARGREPIKFKQ